MASNFRILKKWSEDRIQVKLYGDFDGSSAHELINLLKKHKNSASKIRIYTEGLNQIHPFGMRIFIKSIGIITDCENRIEFLGDKAPYFAETPAYSSL